MTKEEFDSAVMDLCWRYIDGKDQTTGITDVIYVTMCNAMRWVEFVCKNVAEPCNDEEMYTRVATKAKTVMTELRTNGETIQLDMSNVMRQ